MIVNRYFTGGSVVLAAAALLPNLAVSIVATRYITFPFRPSFADSPASGTKKCRSLGGIASS
jgi:hypothetical protein